MQSDNGNLTRLPSHDILAYKTIKASQIVLLGGIHHFQCLACSKSQRAQHCRIEWRHRHLLYLTEIIQYQIVRSGGMYSSCSSSSQGPLARFTVTAFPFLNSWGKVLTKNHGICIYVSSTTECSGHLPSFPGLPHFSSSVCVQYNTQKRKGKAWSHSSREWCQVGKLPGYMQRHIGLTMEICVHSWLPIAMVLQRLHI